MITASQGYSRFIILALIVMSSASAIVFSASAQLSYGGSPVPVVVISFEPMADGRVIELSKDLAMSVLVTAPLPPSMIVGDEYDTKIVFSGVVRNAVTIGEDVIGPLIKGWVDDYERRGSRGPPYIGLSVHVNLVNVTEGSVLGTGIDSVSLDLGRLSAGYVAVYTLTINLGEALGKESGGARVVGLSISGVDYVDRYSAPLLLSSIGGEEQFTVAPSSATQPFLDGYDRCEPINSVMYICYNRTYYADTETFAEALPSNYFVIRDGVAYVRTPILIGVNDVPSYSGTVTASINIGMSDEAIGIYPTYTVGPNIGEALKHPASSTFPSLTLWKGSGVVWGGETYTYGTTLVLTPAYNSGWVWIYARPYLEVYSVYLVVVGGEAAYLHDEVTAAITDVLVEGDDIVGGFEYGLPVNQLLENFLAGTNETYVTSLAPGGSETLESIFQNYDHCGADFEVGMPVGAMVAAAISLVAPIASPVAAGIAGFQVSLSAVGASVWVYGNIVNQGDLGDVPGDYDVYEGVNMRISKYRYKVDPPWWCPWCSPCYYDVPAGIYFRFV